MKTAVAPDQFGHHIVRGADDRIDAGEHAGIAFAGRILHAADGQPVSFGHALHDRAVGFGLAGQGAFRNRRGLLALEIVEGVEVGLLLGEIIIIVFGLLAGRPADEKGLAVDVRRPAVGSGLALQRLHGSADLLEAVERGEQDVGDFRGKSLTAGGRAGRHDRRARLLHRQRIGGQPLQVVKLSLEIELRFAFQNSLDDAGPFEALVVAVIAVDGDAVHAKLVGVPAADDVEADPAVGDVIEGRDGLGDKDRREHRHMGGDENAGFLGHRAERRRLGEGFERASPHVGFTAEAAPAGDRQNELNAGLVGKLGDFGNLLPVGLPAILGDAHRHAAAAIDAEQAELECVRAEELSHRRSSRSFSFMCGRTLPGAPGGGNAVQARGIRRQSVVDAAASAASAP
jgi:hypothetical protein